MYKIIQTNIFNKKFEKMISISLKKSTNLLIKKLGLNPFYGKPLSFRFIRELKIDKFRIYYMVYKVIK